MDKGHIAKSAPHPAVELLKAAAPLLFICAFVLLLSGPHLAAGVFAMVPSTVAQAWARARYPGGAGGAVRWGIALATATISALLLAVLHPDARRVQEGPVIALFVAVMTVIMWFSLGRVLRQPGMPEAKRGVT
jgi:hypothetical protein